MTHGSARVAHKGSSHSGNQNRSRCVIKETTTASIATTARKVNRSRVTSATKGSASILSAWAAPVISGSPPNFRERRTQSALSSLVPAEDHCVRELIIAIAMQQEKAKLKGSASIDAAKRRSA